MLRRFDGRYLISRLFLIFGDLRDFGCGIFVSQSVRNGSPWMRANTGPPVRLDRLLESGAIERDAGSNGYAGRRILRDREWSRLSAALRLSPRELELVQGVFDGQKDGVIAGRLGLSAHTVRTYFERLYRKLRVNSRTELVLHVFGAHLKRL